MSRGNALFAIVGRYILLLNWTDQGIRNAKEAPKRAANFEKMVRKLGGGHVPLHARPVDLVAVAKLTDDESMVSWAWSSGASETSGRPPSRDGRSRRWRAYSPA